MLQQVAFRDQRSSSLSLDLLTAIWSVVGQGVPEARRGRVQGAVPLFFPWEMEHKLTNTSTLTSSTRQHKLKTCVCMIIHIVEGYQELSWLTLAAWRTDCWFLTSSGFLQRLIWLPRLRYGRNHPRLEPRLGAGWHLTWLSLKLAWFWFTDGFQ